MSIKLPTTIEEIMLMQPNNVTFGQYALSEVQENILTLVIDALQAHISKEKELPKDLFNQPYIEINCDEAKKNGKYQIIQAAKDMKKKEFNFKWIHPEIHKTIETSGSIVTTVHSVKNTNRIVINFNPWAIPFLLYYGKGVGGSRFNKAIALTLRGDKVKRIYKFICSQRDKTEFYFDLDEFRKEYEISEKTTNSVIKRDILEPAKKRIMESNSDVWFDFDMITRKKTKGRKPKADTILFKIFSKNPKESKGVQFDEYRFVLFWLERCFDKTINSKAFDFIEKLVEIGKLKDVYNRCCFYDDKFTSGKMEMIHITRSIKKMLREEYDMK